MSEGAPPRRGIGQKIAPPRFFAWALGVCAILLGLHVGLGRSWSDALVVGFDAATLLFALAILPLMRDRTAASMRRHAAENDANRGVVLVITAFSTLAIMAAISAELPAAKHGEVAAVIKLVGTLALAWVFTNLIFMFHYAHMHYGAKAGGGDRGGFEFPGTPEPDYWDFLYFSFTAGMSFAASDVNVTRGAVRRVLVLHCLLSFVFNIGVLAFSINVLAGAAG